jgi:hypothetical protein
MSEYTTSPSGSEARAVRAGFADARFVAVRFAAARFAGFALRAAGLDFRAVFFPLLVFAAMVSLPLSSSDRRGAAV